MKRPHLFPYLFVEVNMTVFNDSTFKDLRDKSENTSPAPAASEDSSKLSKDLSLLGASLGDVAEPDWSDLLSSDGYLYVDDMDEGLGLPIELVNHAYRDIINVANITELNDLGNSWTERHKGKLAYREDLEAHYKWNGSQFSPLDTLHTQAGTAVGVTAGEKSVSFPINFLVPPIVSLTAMSTALRIPVLRSVTRSEFTFVVYSVAGIQQQTNVHWTAGIT